MTRSTVLSSARPRRAWEVICALLAARCVGSAPTRSARSVPLLLALAAVVVQSPSAHAQWRTPPSPWEVGAVVAPEAPGARPTPIGGPSTAELVAAGVVVGIASAAGGALLGAVLVDRRRHDDFRAAVWGYFLVPALVVPPVVHDANQRAGRLGISLAAGLSVAAVSRLAFDAETVDGLWLIAAAPLVQVVSAVAVERLTGRSVP